MKNLKLCGSLLIIVGLLTVVGLLINNSTYWMIIDIIVILSSFGVGLYLLKVSKST